MWSNLRKEALGRETACNCELPSYEQIIPGRRLFPLDAHSPSSWLIYYQLTLLSVCVGWNTSNQAVSYNNGWRWEMVLPAIRTQPTCRYNYEWVTWKQKNPCEQSSEQWNVHGCDHAGKPQRSLRVKGQMTNLDWRSLRSLPRVLQTPLERARDKMARLQKQREQTIKPASRLKGWKCTLEFTVGTT